MAYVRILRTLEYKGKKEWVEKTLANSYVKPGQPVSLGFGWSITEVMRSEMEEIEDDDKPVQADSMGRRREQERRVAEVLSRPRGEGAPAGGKPADYTGESEG